MNIVYLITGSGGSFYCGNCYRDMLYLKAIKKVNGIKASAVPLYLPPDKTNIKNGLEDHLFFGAISMYIREKFPLLRNMPAFFDKILDSPFLLKIAAKQAGTTRTDGLEEMTLNMIEGDNAFRTNEVERLVKYINQNGKPDIIHLSNALILGLARQLKKRMDVKIICSLLNEDDWIDEMAEPYRSKAWKMIAIESGYVDQFVTPSNYYKNLFMSKTGLDGKNIHIVPLGIEPDNFDHLPRNSEHPAIGYFCRISYLNGFDKLVDAFIKLKTERYTELTLHVCGGFTGDDKKFIDSQLKKIHKNGFSGSVKMYHEFEGNDRFEFFSNVDVISVPVRKYDGYGMYILEANGAGIPVVQPATGAFPEIIETTNGGITYSPDSVDRLTLALSEMLDNEHIRKKHGDEGKKGVTNNLSLAKMSVELAAVYNYN